MSYKYDMDEINNLLRNFAYLRKCDKFIIKLCCDLMMKHGASAFYIKDGKTTLDIAIENNNYDLITTFLHIWALSPNWRLHYVIYGLEGNLKMLKYFEEVLNIHKNKQPLVNHALTVLHLMQIS